ncbi:rhodanese-like domain-containing protein [Paenibacillus cremeus]|uniref:Rhodanese-like domain-containing protein n=1 Tax=Paenibacillus cremeus TaxID=2163881 RepID=A0A559KHL9_9BACL|nr:rhodanese-like domain-containing protein [Paenibacillus cremeus]TVY11578.1 rhodanese-like domain-containing protein [Paenibacillus cremeus]
MSIDQIEPDDFLRQMEEGILHEALLIDVREPYEWEYYHLEGIQLMPMNSIPAKLEELPKEKPIYVVCAHGVRSMHVSYYLMQQGFEHVVNVEGGMAALAQLRGFQYD